MTHHGISEQTKYLVLSGIDMWDLETVGLALQWYKEREAMHDDMELSDFLGEAQ